MERMTNDEKNGPDERKRKKRDKFESSEKFGKQRRGVVTDWAGIDLKSERKFGIKRADSSPDVSRGRKEPEAKIPEGGRRSSEAVSNCQRHFSSNVYVPRDLLSFPKK